MTAIRTTIAGIPIPDSTLAREATELVQDVSSQLLSDHSRRVFLWGVVLERHGLPEERVMTVWESIALHTTREIPRYKQPEVRLVSLGVEYDVLGWYFEQIPEEQRAAVLAAHPRAGFKATR